MKGPHVVRMARKHMIRPVHLTEAPIPLLAISRNGVDPTLTGLDAAFGPDDLFRAWQPRG